jgi:OOP family OmpA-OmpF porin
MKRTSGYRMMWLGVVVAIMACIGPAQADFTFGEPVNLGPPVNTEATDGCPVFTADGLAMFFESDRGGAFQVWVATREALDAPWQEPVNLTATLRAEGGFAPNISPDGLTLYFSSWGSGSLNESEDLYVTTRASKDEPWSEPVNLGPNVNSPGFEDGSQVSADGLALYYTSDRFGTPWDLDIWMTTRTAPSEAWTEAVKLGPNINTTDWDFGPHVLPGGRVMLFGSDRPGGVGGHDHWITRRATTSDPWGVAENLGPTINSTADDRCAFLAADGCVYFHSDR